MHTGRIAAIILEKASCRDNTRAFQGVVYGILRPIPCAMARSNIIVPCSFFLRMNASI